MLHSEAPFPGSSHFFQAIKTALICTRTVAATAVTGFSHLCILFLWFLQSGTRVVLAFAMGEASLA